MVSGGRLKVPVACGKKSQKLHRGSRMHVKTVTQNMQGKHALPSISSAIRISNGVISLKSIRKKRLHHMEVEFLVIFYGQTDGPMPPLVEEVTLNGCDFEVEIDNGCACLCCL